MARKNRTQEENARREKIRGLLQMANIDSMDNIQNLFKETIAEFMEKGLEAELDEELGYSKYDYKNKDTDNSRKLSALELLHHARMEWSVEVMHWLLDVHFGEDFCRVEDKNVQQNLNLLRKFAISSVKQYKSVKKSKRPMSNIMFECLLDPLRISDLLNQN